MLPSQQTSLGFCFANENDHVDSFELYLSPIMNCLSKLCNADLCYDILLTSLPGGYFFRYYAFIFHVGSLC